MPSGDRWGARRSLFHEIMNGRLTRNFDNYHLKYVHRFLSHLLEAPESFMQETELYVVSYPFVPRSSAYTSLNLQSIPGAVIMSITYGIDIESADNPFLSANLAATQGLATALVPGKFLVDTIPIRTRPDTRTTPTKTDEIMDSPISTRLVPRDRIQGSRQRSA